MEKLHSGARFERDTCWNAPPTCTYMYVIKNKINQLCSLICIQLMHTMMWVAQHNQCVKNSIFRMEYRLHSPNLGYGYAGVCFLTIIHRTGPIRNGRDYTHNSPTLNHSSDERCNGIPFNILKSGIHQYELVPNHCICTGERPLAEIHVIQARSDRRALMPNQLLYLYTRVWNYN